MIMKADAGGILRFTAEAQESGERLDLVLSRHDGLSRSAVQKAIEAGNVTVNGLVAVKNYKIRTGDCIEYVQSVPQPLDASAENIPLDIVYEDNDIIVINKPQGMVVHPAAGNVNGTLVNALLYHCGDSLSGINGVIRPGIVHRIDKDTSGLLAVAKNDDAHRCLAEQLKRRTMSRIYRGIALGNFKEDTGTIDAPIARHPVHRKKMTVLQSSVSREAVTHYEVLERYEGITYLQFRLETGRTHQIRVHLAHIGHPLVGDPLYGAGRHPFERKHAALLHGQCLHAYALKLKHPRTGEELFFTSELPDNFVKILDILRRSFT